MRNDYQNEKDFLKSLATAFGVSKDGSRSGVVTFSLQAKHSIKMSDHTDIQSFSAAVDGIKLMGLTTRIDRALRLAQKELFALKNGGRPTIPKILILLTDGSQTPGADAEDPAVVADELRYDGITVLVVGIGKGINALELGKIAGGSDKTFTAASFTDLMAVDFVANVTDTSCVAGMVYLLLFYFHTILTSSARLAFLEVTDFERKKENFRTFLGRFDEIETSDTHVVRWFPTQNLMWTLMHSII